MTDTLNTPGKRIKYLRKKLKMSQTELAALCGWDTPNSRTRLGNYERDLRKFPREAAELAAKPLKTTPEWLMFGRGTEEVGAMDNSGLAVFGHAVSYIPLIGWDEAAGFTKVFDMIEGHKKKLKERWQLIPTAVNTGRRCYSLQIKDDSMVSPHGAVSFEPGNIIYVDPDKPYKNGSFVVAELSEGEDAVLKKYTRQGEKAYLISLNQAYPTIEITDKSVIKGTVTIIANMVFLD